MLEIKVLLKEDAIAPEVKTSGAAGADITAYLPTGDFVLSGLSWAAIPTGVSLSIPDGYEIQVRPRSGLAAKYGITVLNSPGTIDSDYRGEVKVILINHSKEPFTIHHHDRIAQLVFAKVIPSKYTVVQELDETLRGSGGFGSTGV